YLPPAPPPGAVAIAAAPAPVVAAPPAALAAAPSGSAPDARIPRLAELPDSLRRELPPLAISGSVYSDDPASRFVMINGEVQREGAKLGAELVLEQIRPRELVLRFKGQRYRQPV
ncbi:MAG: general secretion pathway protein GspB, partial [Comamonadaceae bacterium]|nr:general secretion pathway protein GspB [Comamonadaceae bacterium]